MQFDLLSILPKTFIMSTPPNFRCHCCHPSNFISHLPPLSYNIYKYIQGSHNALYWYLSKSVSNTWLPLRKNDENDIVHVRQRGCLFIVTLNTWLESPCCKVSSHRIQNVVTASGLVTAALGSMATNGIECPHSVGTTTRISFLEETAMNTK